VVLYSNFTSGSRYNIQQISDGEYMVKIIMAKPSVALAIDSVRENV